MRVRISIDKDNLLYNVKAVKEHSNKEIIAVVKDNAYSHGSREIISVLNSAGINYYAVATIEEGIEIADLAENILLFETLEGDEIKIASYFDFIVSLTSEEYIDRLIELKIPLRCHLKVDTGMNRYGVNPNDVERLVNKIKKSSLKLEGIYTHYAGENKEDMQKEYDIFKESIKNINTYGLMIHTQKSNAIFEIDDEVSTHCRIGLSLYGISNIKEHRKYTKPILNVYAYPTRIKKVKKGETLGYNCSFVVPKDGYAVTIDYGYGDGLLTKDEILFMVNNKIYNHDRRVLCMDSMILFMEEEVSMNTKFEFVNETLSMNFYRDLWGYRAAELSTKLSKRIKRKAK